MYQLTDQQIDFITEDLRNRGITLEDLQNNLLDHICILIENGLEEPGDFEQFYNTTIRSFYKEELQELQEEAIFLATARPLLVLRRGQFFLLLFSLVLAPFFAYDLHWYLTSPEVNGMQHIPIHIWGSTLVFSLFPLLVLLVLLLTPDHLDPVIPRGAMVVLGRRPAIRIIPPAKDLNPIDLGVDA